MLTLFWFFTVRHGSEVSYVYGFSYIGAANPESGLVSRAMIDYWVSFAVSGTPNDGKGRPSACCVLVLSLGFSNDGAAYRQELFGRSTNPTTRYVRFLHKTT